MGLISEKERIELKLYRALGIRRFRDGAFLLERWVHRRDGRKNSNYHVRAYSLYSLEEHYAYLSFNAAIHVTAIVLLLLITLGASLIEDFRKGWYWFYLFLFVLNVYCIMLQRYNALRLRELQARLEARYRRRIRERAALLRQKTPDGYSERRMEQDAAWLGELRDALCGKRDVRIRREDMERLTRLRQWSQNAGITWGERGKPLQDPLLPQNGGEAPLYTKMDTNVRWLQGVFHREKNRVLRPCAVITEDAECEEAYSRLVGRDSRESVLELADTFLCLFEDRAGLRDAAAEQVEQMERGT